MSSRQPLAKRAPPRRLRAVLAPPRVGAQ